MHESTDIVSVGIVGLGYWGPNLARNLRRTPGCELRWACDLDQANHARHAALLPGTRFTTRLDDLLADETLDAVVVATASSTHAPIGRAVIDAGKHLFVEKPLALDADEARELVASAQAADRVVMVGHLLRFHPAFRLIQQLVLDDRLGRVLYLYANRQNFGKVRRDESALWSLAPHDISMVLALAGERPLEVAAHGASYLQPGIEDVVFGYVTFPSGIVAHLHLSWLDPHKRRMLTVVGTERMVVFDDTETDRKLTLYEKTSWPKRFESWGEFQALQSGDIHIPRLANEEPLALEMDAFVAGIRTGQLDINTGAEGLAVVEVLEALQRSLEAGGSPIMLGEPARL